MFAIEYLCDQSPAARQFLLMDWWSYGPGQNSRNSGMLCLDYACLEDWLIDVWESPT